MIQYEFILSEDEFTKKGIYEYSALWSQSNEKEAICFVLMYRRSMYKFGEVMLDAAQTAANIEVLGAMTRYTVSYE